MLKFGWVPTYVPKLPTMLITKKIAPSLLRMVKYEPPALPSTGYSAAALTRRSNTAPGDPKTSLVAYAVNAKTRMIMRSIKV
jgi:hypothetical protein